MNFLNNWWKNQESPIINGVMFGDGFVACAGPLIRPRSGGTTLVLKTVGKALSDFAPVDVTSLTASCRHEDKARGMVAIGGGAGMGADGFIALSDQEDELIWLAFFDFSNPFDSVELREEEVVAKNNLGEAWHIRLKLHRRF